ncbi:MAG: SDR family oxidoreductase [Ilumatobacteraceae bacterium]|nr:SDR family oxidoreductase [Ilumatobacteraceae bacterium]
MSARADSFNPSDAQGIDLSVRGRTAMITGGGGAIASSTAVALAERGVAVALLDNDEPRLSAVVDAVEAVGGRAVPIVCDATAEGAITEAVDTAMTELGSIEVLVNALGDHCGVSGRFVESTPTDWDRLYRANVLHVFEACRAVLPGMMERGWGRIVNFSSVEGMRAAPNFSVYAAFKAAIDGFTKSLAIDVARSGINVNAIAVDKTRAYQVGFYDIGDEYDEHIPIWVPAGRYGEGRDIAGIVLFLVSELGDFVVGRSMVADGGTLAAGGWYRTRDRFTNSPLLAQHLGEDPSANAQRPPSLR